MLASASVFLGFFPKRPGPQPSSWLTPVGNVQEICAVSECAAEGPDDWISRWEHNEAGYYDTEDVALGIIPDSEARSGWWLYAYRLWLPRFVRGEDDEDWNPREQWSDLPDEPSLSEYEFLGYDLVSKSVSDFFECSPFSCCNVAAKYDANRYCLLSDLSRAREVGRRFSLIQPNEVEPGDYYVVEVLRRSVASAEPPAGA